MSLTKDDLLKEIPTRKYRGDVPCDHCGKPHNRVTTGSGLALWSNEECGDYYRPSLEKQNDRLKARVAKDRRLFEKALRRVSNSPIGEPSHIVVSAIVEILQGALEERA